MTVIDKAHYKRATNNSTAEITYFQSFLMDIFFSESFCITLATAISKSS